MTRGASVQTTAKKSRNLFFSGVLILTISNVIIKIIGLTLKIPLTALLGDEGMGYYTAASNVYVWLYMISTTGLPVAISIMISESRTKGNFREVKRIFRITLISFIIIGLAGMTVMMAGSGIFARLYKMEPAAICLVAIAPTLFFICISSAIRGFFQGHQDMLPTAVSQLIEALSKLVIGLALAYWAIKAGKSLPEVAAFAILGLTIGAALGMLFLIVAKLMFKESVYNEEFRVPDSDTMPVRKSSALFGTLVMIAIPVTLSSSIMSFTTVVDGIVITNRLSSLGYANDIVTAMFGNYNARAVSMFNMPPALIYPISYSIIPLLSSAITAEDKKRADVITNSAFKVAALIAIPCSIGLSVLSEPILKLVFFSSSQESSVTAAPYLSVLSLSIFFVGMLAISNAVLQAYKLERKPIISMIAGSVVKILTSFILIGTPGIELYGAPIGTFLCYLTIVAFNFYFIIRHVGYVPDFKRILLRPFAASIVCGLSAIGSYKLLSLISGSRLIVLGAIFVAIVVYGIMIFVLRAVTKDDILLLPKGKKIFSILNKLRLMK